MPDTETSFQRALRLADERKAQQWREYHARDPLPKAAFVDYEVRLEPILLSYSTGHGERRSSRAARMYDHAYIVKRPTETLAFARARGDDWRDHLHVIRQEPRQQSRYCYGCGKHHPLADFDFITKKYPQPSGHRRTPPGYRWYCRSYLRKKKLLRAA